ncbi:hypothetical protein SERN_1671 [Serinibacter arcticus]|uniref:Uncharacterized protein n=1 Tax=Serinibacter arcticus TaxID=1655435 RepID=A0A4Z1E7L9_9MICO|nr:hypothetical protein SERN_1671 [Serinibacter arcticus]
MDTVIIETPAARATSFIVTTAVAYGIRWSVVWSSVGR